MECSPCRTNFARAGPGPPGAQCAITSYTFLASPGAQCVILPKMILRTGGASRAMESESLHAHPPAHCVISSPHILEHLSAVCVAVRLPVLYGALGRRLSRSMAALRFLAVRLGD